MTENKSGSRPEIGDGTSAQGNSALSSKPLSSKQIVAFLTQLREQSEASGLNLFHAWTAAELRQADIGWLPAAAETRGNDGLLLMFGNAGGGFWQFFQQHSENMLPGRSNLEETLAGILMDAELGQDPIDAFAVKQASLAISTALHGLFDQHRPAVGNQALAPQFVYPSNAGQVTANSNHPPLQRLGELAGWHQPSPLGTGINPRWGLWYAYRALVWLPLPLPMDVTLTARDNTAELTQSTSVCASCESQACISVCPATALSFLQAPDMNACAGYRMQAASDCSDRCLAREACPVNSDNRYPRQQINYHYRKALAGLLKYFADSKSQL